MKNTTKTGDPHITAMLTFVLDHQSDTAKGLIELTQQSFNESEFTQQILRGCHAMICLEPDTNLGVQTLSQFAAIVFAAGVQYGKEVL